MISVLVILIFVQGVILPEYIASKIDDYSSLSRYISELGANGAPYQLFVNTSLFLPVGFAILLLVYLIYTNIVNGEKLMRAKGLLALPGAAYVGSVFLPCEPGCPLLTTSPIQIIHNILGLMQYTGAISGIAIWANWFKKMDTGFYKVASWGAVFFIVTGAIGMLIPHFTEFRGLLQRLADYSYFVWLSLLAGYITIDKKD